MIVHNAIICVHKLSRELNLLSLLSASQTSSLTDFFFQDVLHVMVLARPVEGCCRRHRGATAETPTADIHTHNATQCSKKHGCIPYCTDKYPVHGHLVTGTKSVWHKITLILFVVFVLIAAGPVSAYTSFPLIRPPSKCHILNENGMLSHYEC